MACELATVQANACTSGIGRVTNKLKLLQLTAQAAATWAEISNPGVDYSVDAILDRACASGIGLRSDRLALLRTIAQNLCGEIGAPVMFKANPATAFLQWTWSGSDPDHWTTEGSDDQTSWTVFGTVTGSLHQTNGHHDYAYWRTRGYDADDEPVTGYSNILPDS